MKFGYQGGFSNPTQTYSYFNQVIAGPDQRRRAEPAHADHRLPGPTRQVRPQPPADDFYAQDQWTRSRLTLQGGVRYDHLLIELSRLGRSAARAIRPRRQEIVYPARSTQGYDWNDVTPRMGVAYDLFGNGKTAVKFNLGKYMEAITATNSDLDLNPLIRIDHVSTTRTWTDTNKDFVPNCDLANPAKNGECGAMDNKNLGQEVFTRTFDPNFVDRLGHPPVQLGPRRVGAAGSRCRASR